MFDHVSSLKENAMSRVFVQVPFAPIGGLPSSKPNTSDEKRPRMLKDYPRETMLKLSRDDVFAWIRPAGEIEFVHQFGHFDFLKTYWGADKPPGLEGYFELREIDMQSKADIWEAKMAGQHPEWHTFEYYYAFNPEQSVTSKYLWKAYEAGWGRLGTFGGDKIELECAEGFVRKLSRGVRSIGDVVGREVTINVVSPYEDQIFGTDIPAGSSPPKP